jgi:hypothetical protein
VRSASRSASRSRRPTTAIAHAASDEREPRRPQTAARPRARSSSSRARSTCARGLLRAAQRRSSAGCAARPSSVAVPAIRRRSACGSGRSMPIPASGRNGGSSPPMPRPGRRSRTTGCRGTRKAERNARSRVPSSSCFIGGNSRRRLRPGETAAPERESLALLPSGPDAVRMLSVRGTRPSTPRARDLIPLKPSLGRRSAPLERMSGSGNR